MVQYILSGQISNTLLTTSVARDMTFSSSSASFISMTTLWTLNSIIAAGVEKSPESDKEAQSSKLTISSSSFSFGIKRIALLIARSIVSFCLLFTGAFVVMLRYGMLILLFQCGEVKCFSYKSTKAYHVDNIINN